MSNSDTLLILEQPCDEAVDWVSEKMTLAGLSVICTFDLQLARRAQTVCVCPQHGAEQCDCQMVVLMVYQDNRQPLTIVANGYSGQTWFSVVDTPQQRADPHLEASIRQLLASPFLHPNHLISGTHDV